MVELRLEHAGEALRPFYAALPKASVVGIESVGYTQWFERLLTEWGHALSWLAGFRPRGPQNIFTARSRGCRPTGISVISPPGGEETPALKVARERTTARSSETLVDDQQHIPSGGN